MEILSGGMLIKNALFFVLGAVFVLTINTFSIQLPSNEDYVLLQRAAMERICAEHENNELAIWTKI